MTFDLQNYVTEIKVVYILREIKFKHFCLENVKKDINVMIGEDIENNICKEDYLDTLCYFALLNNNIKSFLRI